MPKKQSRSFNCRRSAYQEPTANRQRSIMNKHCLWRLAMARKVAPVYAANHKVAAIMVAGSVARGFADRHSDVEVGVFWNELPEPAELRGAMGLLQGTDWELDPYEVGQDVWYEEFLVDGLKIDLRHMTVARMSELLTAVLECGDGS